MKGNYSKKNVTYYVSTVKNQSEKGGMLVYKIVLEFSFPLNINTYREASIIKPTEAPWIFEHFPFEEPQYFIDRPEEGPAPHFLFANFRNKSYLLVSYLGDGNFGIGLGRSEGKFRELGRFEMPFTIEVIEKFGIEDCPFPKLQRRLQRLIRPASGFLFG
jgi:hypothetical protein